MNIKLERLRKSFGAGPVLNDLSLEMKEGHVLVIIGPSGVGKSTLLRLIAGLELPDSGIIYFEGAPIPVDPAGLLRHRQNIGMLFQMFNLFPHLSALKNVMLPLVKAHGFSKEAARQRALELLDRFSLLSHADKFPSALSGGHKQRVALVRSMAINPKLFLLDEPTSALDPEMTSEMLDAIGELKKEKKDFILVTHHLGFAKQAADQVAFLDKGQILETAPVEKFFASPKTPEVRAFLAKILKY